MPIATAVKRNDGVGAAFTACHMTAKRRRAAALDGTHHLQLVEAHVTDVGSTPRRSVVAEDIRDLQGWTGHDRGLLRRRLAFPILPELLARLGQKIEGGSQHRRSCRWRHGCSAPSCPTCRDPTALG